MIRIIVFLLSFLLSAALFAQEAKQKDIVYLKNGDKLTGEITVKTSNIIILQTRDGKRYQIPLSEIEKTDIKEAEPIKEKATISNTKNSFGVLVGINGSIVSTRSTTIPATPAISATLALGTRNTFDSNTFVGLGTGFETTITRKNNQTLSSFPVFVQIHKALSDKRICPYAEAIAGYAFGLDKNYKGGVLFRISGGMNFRITEKQFYSVGFFGAIRQISGTIIEINELGKFTVQGTAPAYSLGLNISYSF